MLYQGQTNEFVEILAINNENASILEDAKESQLAILWFTSDDNQLTIDTVSYTFNTNQIVCLTEFHKVKIEQINKVRFLRFNAPFYCILNHDSEVGCKGVLYYGSSNTPILNPSSEDIFTFSSTWNMFISEMQSKDNLQLEMLQMMLKRMLIICTRIYKEQQKYNTIETPKQVDIVREFNFLVEQHFKTKHTVTEYAELLNKSPKTISNLFKKVSNRTPLQFIQDRKMLEARRLIRYTDKPISEVGYDLGYDDIQSFSRFFKKHEGISPTEFKNFRPQGKIANS